MRTNKRPINFDLVSRMKDALSYSPHSGEFRWVNPSKYHQKLKDKPAGEYVRNGYLLIQFEGIKYSAHRMAWAFVHGIIMPDTELDHINNNRSDNRIENLRIATFNDNSFNQRMKRNNTSGVKGVSLHNLSGKWRGRVCMNGITHYVGHFNDLDTAKKAVEQVRLSLHKDFTNNG